MSNLTPHNGADIDPFALERRPGESDDEFSNRMSVESTNVQFYDLPVEAREIIQKIHSALTELAQLCQITQRLDEQNDMRMNAINLYVLRMMELAECVIEGNEQVSQTAYEELRNILNHTLAEEG